MVLLKNKDSILPLDKKKIKRIAVIGPNANSRDALVGNYTGTSSKYITPLEGIQRYLEDDAEVLYAEGCHLYKDKVEFLAEEKDRFAEAVITAERADAVIMCLGLDATIEGEEGDAGNEYASGDKPDLKLPGLQQELLETVTAVGKPVILVLLAGSAIDLSWAENHVDAIICAWYPGARGGKAVAETIFGENSPSGRLPVTFYADTKGLPDFCDYSMKNRTYRYTGCEVLYPFGYGLSYTDICYQEAEIGSGKSDVKDSVTLKVKVANNGSYSVHESVQVYIKHVDAMDYEPGYQLKGICNVFLNPCEAKEVEITLNARDFAIITQEGKCVVKPGSYLVSIGGFQPDKRSEELTGHGIDTFVIERTGQEEEIEY